MIVLLIDGVGNVREMDIGELVPVITIPLQRRMTIYPVPMYVAGMDFPMAEFHFSDEQSYPPVYRQKVT